MRYSNRLLGAFEKFLWILDQHIPTHFVMAAEIEGRTGLDDWRLALLNLQKRHPLFSVCITGSEHTAVRFKQVEGVPIPFRVVADGSLESLEKEMERELSAPFNTSQAPLIRVVLIEAQTNSTLLFAVHHAIGDGISLTLVMRDLLKSLNKQALEVLPFPPAIDDLLNMNDDQQVNDQSLEVSTKAISFVDQRIPVASPVVALLKLNQDLTAKLIKYTRQEQTTVYATIAAAITLASRQIYDKGKEKTIRLITPVCIRELLHLNEGSSLCITNKFHVIEPAGSPTLSDTARQINSDLAGTKTTGYIRSGTEEFRALAFGGALTVKEGARLMKDQFDHELIVSNLGVIPYETKFGTFELKTIWGPMQFNANPIEHSIGIATINGVIAITYASRAPLKNLLPLMRQILQESCP